MNSLTMIPQLWILYPASNYMCVIIPMFLLLTWAGKCRLGSKVTRLLSSFIKKKSELPAKHHDVPKSNYFTEDIRLKLTVLAFFFLTKCSLFSSSYFQKHIFFRLNLEHILFSMKQNSLFRKKFAFCSCALKCVEMVWSGYIEVVEIS